MKTARVGWIASLCLLAACTATRHHDDVVWSMAQCGVDASLRGLAPVSRDVCYVGGANGTLRKTVDGGSSWVDVAPTGSAGCDFRDLEAISADTVVALVAGSPARLYRTEDGGASWRVVHEDVRAGAFLDAAAFDGLHGVVFGDAINGRFVLLETFDGGASWRDVSSPALPSPGAGEAAFAASGTCLSVGPASFSLVTGGGPCRFIAFEPGVECGAVDLPLQRGDASRGAFSIAWNGERGVSVGGDYRAPSRAGGTAAVTLDGGRTWTAANAGGYRSGVAWVGDRDLLAVGSHGASWSRDGGVTWAQFGGEAFHSVAKAVDGAVWACGAHGRVGVLLAPGGR
ncbi:MAG: YCF48-related protein [Planctomycetota bacterium]|nr:YCF48-related protein [Planctomycetota bacterium]